MVVQEYRVLAAFVQRVRRGLTLRRLLQSGIVLLTVMLTLLLLGLGVQHILPLAPLVAPLYSLLALGVVVYLGVYVVWPALRPLSLRQALSSIEATYPDLHDDLTNALQLDPAVLERSNPHGIALDLVQALHHRTARQVQQYSVPAMVRQRRLVGLPWCAMVGLATVLVAIMQPHMLGEAVRILVQPLSYLPSREIHIALTPEHATIAAGTNFEVQAQASGRLPQSMQLLVKRQGQPDKRYPMEALGQGRVSLHVSEAASRVDVSGHSRRLYVRCGNPRCGAGPGYRPYGTAVCLPRVYWPPGAYAGRRGGYSGPARHAGATEHAGQRAPDQGRVAF